MPDFIALDWERQYLIGLDAQTGKGRVHVRQCFRLAWPEEITGDPVRAGQWLKQELHKLGIKAKEVLVSLPREEAVVRQLDVPDVPDNELPDLVRLQAETRSASSLDRLILDFLPLPKTGDGPGRQVLVVTIPREKIDRLKGIIDAAGLEAASIGISPIGAGEIIARTDRTQAASGETTLIVARTGKRVEISLVRQNQLLFTHSAQLHGDDDETDSRAAMAEIRRTLGAQARVDADMTVNRVRIIGSEDENRTLRRLLEEHLECVVLAIDPLVDAPISVDASDSSHRHAAYAGPIGMLLATQSPLVPAIDFLHPREPVVPRDLRKVKFAAAAAAVVLLVGGLATYTWLRVRSLNAQIDVLAKNTARITDALTKGKPRIDAAVVVDDWQRRSVDPLAHFNAIAAILPGNDRLYLKNWSVVPATGSGAPQIDSTGIAKEREDLQELAADLAAKDYAVTLRSQMSRDSDDTQYPWRAEYRLTLPLDPPTVTPLAGSRLVRTPAR